MKTKISLDKLLIQTKQAAIDCSQYTSAVKRKALKATAQALKKSAAAILSENAKDLQAAEQRNISPAMLDRLTLNRDRIAQMADGVSSVAELSDPVGKVLSEWTRPNGLRIRKVAVPIGVILIIYESRPNVTVECASLCFKSGNAVILRGGSEAFYSNRVLAGIFHRTFQIQGLSSACVSFVETTDRSVVDRLLIRDQDIHLVIPRGGESLIRRVAQKSRIPVIKHYKGVCHVYVDKDADLKKATDIILNAKLQRTGVCNATETLLVHEKIARPFLLLAGEKLRNAGCELRADAQTRSILPWAKRAKPDDYGTEFLDKILAVKVVKSVDEAIAHIQKYGSAHTDAIVTDNLSAARWFEKRVDSSSVMWNASTRFSDGFQYGFGAEIGISTDKIHARGPMGLDGLMSYKYIVEGNGHIRTS